MPDIIDVIREDHEHQRLAFAHLEATTDGAEQQRRWTELRDLLEVHAAAEEAVFYPRLVRLSESDADEVKDAVEEHNQIRAAIGEVGEHQPGTDLYLLAIRQAKSTNDHHMGEEETEVLPEAARRLDAAERERLGSAFAQFKTSHPGGRGADTQSKDPARYIANLGR